MGSEPEPDVFQHPPCDDCYEPIDHDVQLSEMLVIRDYQRHCQGRLVFFSLQLCRTAGGEREKVARVDTSHGEVHIHVFKRGNNEVKRTVICPIPVDTSSKVLDHAYQDAYDRLLEDGPALIEGW